MPPLSKEEAEKISQLTSSIFQQGSTWVFQEFQLESGATRLTRGLSHADALHKLKEWRKERVERLLRENKDSTVYTIRYWKENPTWGGVSIWQWAKKNWYTTREDAEKALSQLEAKLKEKDETASAEIKYEIHEVTTEHLPGHFQVA